MIIYRLYRKNNSKFIFYRLYSIKYEFNLMRRIFLPDLCASCENRKRQLAGRRSDRASRCEHRKHKGHPGKCCGRGKSLPDYPSPQRQLRFLTPLVARWTPPHIHTSVACHAARCPPWCPQVKSGGRAWVTFSFRRNTFLCSSSSSGSAFSLPAWNTWHSQALRN